jgi:hypothetical protein
MGLAYVTKCGLLTRLRLVHLLVAAGIDSRVHLTRILTQYFARGGADLSTQSESQTSCTLHLVLHQPMYTVRQQPARK